MGSYYQIFFSPNVLKKCKEMEPHDNSVFYFFALRLRSSGIEFFKKSEISFYGNQFILQCPRNYHYAIDNHWGIEKTVIIGHTSSGYDNRYFIDDVFVDIRGQCKITKQRIPSIPPKDRLWSEDEYSALPDDWQSDLETLDKRHCPHTSVSFVLSRFFTKYKDIEPYYTHQTAYDIDDFIDPIIADTERISYYRLDPDSEEVHKIKLHRFLEQKSQKQGVLTFCTFVDENNVLSLAQRNLTRCIAFAVRNLCKTIRVNVIEAIICDKRGRTAFMREYSHYLKSNLLGDVNAIVGTNFKTRRKRKPFFTMVWGAPYQKEQEQIVLPTFQQGRLMDFAILQKAGSDSYWKFSNHLKATVDKVITLASQFDYIFSPLSFNCEYMDEFQISLFEAKLSETAIVVCVNGCEKSLEYKASVQAATQAIAAGYPNVVILQSTLPKDDLPIEIFTREDFCSFVRKPVQSEQEDDFMHSVWEIYSDIIDAYPYIGKSVSTKSASKSSLDTDKTASQLVLI